MNNCPELLEKAKALCDLSMRNETYVTLLSSGDYLTEFCSFYEIKNREVKLTTSPNGFEGTLREVSGDDVCQQIASKTLEVFGAPKRVTVFEDASPLISELEGEDGLAPFYIVFDIMFCEYDDLTLCFISGTNN